MTRSPRRIALIGLGEVGQVLANDLHDAAGVELCAWDRLFPVTGSEPQHAVAARPFLAAASDLAEAVHGRPLIICAITAGECRAAAAAAAGALTPGAFYLDLNSVSPRTRLEAARAIESVGGRYVEAAGMSPIAPKRIASPSWSLCSPDSFLPKSCHPNGLAAKSPYVRTCQVVGYRKLSGWFRIATPTVFPATGPVLFVANHVSHIDAGLILAAQKRRVRFVIWAPYMRIPVLRLLLRWAGVIPIVLIISNPFFFSGTMGGESVPNRK